MNSPYLCQKDMLKFSIKNELKIRGDIIDASDKIMKKMPESILFSKSKEELCFFILNEFDFPEGTINKINFSSLETGCKFILNLMGIEDDFETSLKIESESKWDNQLDRFLYYFLDFKGLPGIYREQLESKVKSDLEEISYYIARYEEIDFIKKGETPRNHNQKTQSDFYKRCLTEKEKIENHLANGINDRALSKARRDNMWGFVELMLDEFKDRPYRIPNPKSKEYFDLDSIDKVGHRLGEITSIEGRELKKLYKTDKALFYEELEKYIPDSQVLSTMLQQLEFLPYISEQRKLIFSELIELYSTNKWFGFYALGMTQIEGLFTEMCKMCDPNYNNPYASLPDKVNTLRPFHPYSENRFDYFQYHLPTLRNRFLHFGIDGKEKIKILCKEILFDLAKVVSIFATLTIDANWLLRLIRERDVVKFLSIKDFCSYFKLIQSVKSKKQFAYFEKEIKSLNETYIPPVLNDVVYDLEDRIKQIIERIYEPMKFQSAVAGFEVDLKTINLSAIASNRDKIKGALHSFFTWQFQSEIEELLETKILIDKYSKYLDLNFISIEVQESINNLNTEYGKTLKKIKLIALIVNFNSDEAFG